MQPRWNKRTLEEDGAAFLGGYDRYDLWLLHGTLLRVVWGVATSEWDTYYAGEHDFYHKEAGRPQDEDFAMILQYVRLFAPDAASKLKLVEEHT
jgi:hypothetical protein